jgi:hypothetical protein
MPDPIDLFPGQTALIGHDAGDVPLADGESVTVNAVTPPPEPTSSRFRLIDPVADTEGDLIEQGALLGGPFAMKFEAPEGTRSVVFELDDDELRTENNPPYAPFADQNGDYQDAALGPGIYRLWASSYSDRNGGGNLIGQSSILFQVADDTPPPDPTPTNPSGIPMPTKAKAGWKIVKATDFNEDIPLGSWKGDKQGAVQPRPDAARDGTYRDSSGRGIYDAKRCISQENGVLVQRLLQAANGQRYMGAPIQTLEPQRDLRVTVCMKVEKPVAGWKIAPLTSVNGDNVAQRGEYDIPEGQLVPGGEPSGYIHVKGNNQSRHKLPKPNGKPAIYEWHTYTTEVRGGQYVEFYFDGQLLARRTDNVTTEPVRWVGQHETLLGGDPIPAKMDEARVLTDWIVFEIPA